MTHKDIYTKFMIEYDKAGASTSYPSLTEYEVATVLDKAYNALIAQKVTGNNVRRATFESDIKSIADLGPLVNTAILEGEDDDSIAPNIYKFDLTKDKDQNKTNLLYFLQGSMLYNGPKSIIGHKYTPFYIAPDKHIDISDQDAMEEYRIMPGFSGIVDGDIYDNGTATDSTLYLIYSTEHLKFMVTNTTAYYSDANVLSYSTSLNSLNTSDWCIVCETDDHVTGENVRRHPNKLFLVIDGKLIEEPIGELIANNNTHYITFYSSEYTKNTVYNPIDKVFTKRGMPVKLVNHEMAQKFFTSASNIPWIKQPICFIEGHDIFVVYDLLNPPSNSFRITYIKLPNTFVKKLTDFGSGTWTYFTPDSGASSDETQLYEFECNSTVAEELVSLAVAFALENVESQRLNSKLNMRGLEA